MKAVVYDGRSVALAEHPEPVLGPGEALLRPIRVGLTDADLAVADRRLKFRGVLGHEMVATVERVAEGAPTTWVGKRVVASPSVPCGVCERCRGGLASQCALRRVLGLHERDGCWAERVAVPAAGLAEVPKAVTDDAALLAGVVGAAVHAAAVTRLEGKTYVSIVGDTALGLIAAQVFARLNASVRVLGWEPARLALCDKWRLKHRHADEVGRRQDQDLVFETTGSARGLSLAGAMVRPRGRVLIAQTIPHVPRAALPDDMPGFDAAALAQGEFEAIGVGCGSIREGIDTLARATVDLAGLVTRKARLWDPAGACEAALDRACVRLALEEPRH